MIEQLSYTGNTIKEEVVTTSPVTRTIADENGNVVATLTAEPFNGKAQFEYQAIIRSLFHDGRTLFPYCVLHYKDHALRAKVRINGTGYTFIRGVAQYGMTSKAQPFAFRTLMPCLRWYEGFDIGVVHAVDGRNGSWDVLINGDLLEQDEEHRQIKNEVVYTDLSRNPYGHAYDGVLSINHDQQTLDAIKIIDTPAPAHPFYVRWINELGGYDYFMFACNQKVSLGLTANDYYEPSDREGVSITYNKKAKEVVETSTGIVDRQTLEAIAKLPLSPDIRLYNQDTHEWLPIQIEDGNTELMQAQPTGELIISFMLPVIQSK